MKLIKVKYAMGLLPVDRLERSTRKNYNLTFKLISLRKPRKYYLPYNLSKIKTLLLNALRRQNPVVLKACSLMLQVLLLNIHITTEDLL